MWYFKQYRVVTFRLLQNFEVELNASHSKRSHFLITIQPGLYKTVSYDYIMISTTLTKIELMSDLMVIVCLPWVPWEEGLSYVAGAMHNQMPIHDDCHRLYRQHPNSLYKCRLNICTLVECNFLGLLTAGSYRFGIRTCLLPCFQMPYYSRLHGTLLTIE